ATLTNAKTLIPQPYPRLSKSPGARSGTTPPKMERKSVPAAMADAAYFSNESM
ncbi:hypothetical protein LTS18_010455, partial [Coniosporium uncinatum]